MPEPEAPIPKCRFCRLPVYARNFPLDPSEHPWCASFVGMAVVSECYRCGKVGAPGTTKFIVVRGKALEVLCLLCTKETVIFDEDPKSKARSA